MAISMSPATAGEKEIRTDWPHVVGISGGYYKQEGEQIGMVPEESLVRENEKVGL